MLQLYTIIHQLTLLCFWVNVFICSLCGLLSEIPNLLDVNDSANDTIIKEVILKLWNFVLQRSDPREIQGALNALSSFTLEQISEYIPEEFKDENTEMDQFNQISGITEFKNCFWPRKI